MYFYDQTFATLDSVGVLKLSILDSFRVLFIPHPWWTCTLELGSCGSSYINCKVVQGGDRTVLGITGTGTTAHAGGCGA